MKLTPLENWVMHKSGIKERNRKALEEYQLNKVKQTISYVKENSRFYREQLKNINVDEIHSLADVRSIPFTFPHQIMQNPLGFLCVSQSGVKRIVTLNSSGTSGEEKRIYFTEEDLNSTVDFFKYGMKSLTDNTDRVMIFLPGNTYGSIGDLLKKALEMSGTECFVHGVMVNPEETAKDIIERNITCIVGIPTQILYLSRVKSEIFKSRIKKVLLSTDYVPEVLISELTRRYGCKVFTHYGMTEMGYGGGVECEALNGYHMREADLYFEIINPDTGEAVSNGQLGEVVFTTLTRQAMPLIRYRTGDMASFSSTGCACGTFLKTIKRVRGRLDNKVCVSGNRFIYLNEIDEIVLAFREVMDYKAYLSSEGSLNIEIVSENDEAFQKIKSKIVGKLEESLYEKLECKINLQVIQKQSNESDILSNSMTKRKIYDLRAVRNNEDRRCDYSCGNVIPHERF